MLLFHEFNMYLSQSKYYDDQCELNIIIVDVIYSTSLVIGRQSVGLYFNCHLLISSHPLRLTIKLQDCIIGGR